MISSTLLNTIVNDSDSLKISELLSNNAELVYSVWQDWTNSEQRKYMDVCDKYYKNHSDIEESKRMVFGRSAGDHPEPALVESKVLANNKIQHNFFRKLIRQKLGYMLGKPFSLDSVNQMDDRTDTFFKEVNKRLNSNCRRCIKLSARDSIEKGLGWIRVYYDEFGNLSFKHLAPENCAPLWADPDHTELNQFIYVYSEKKYSERGATTNTYMEYFTSEGIYYFVQDQDSGRWKPDTREPHSLGFSAHFFVIGDKGKSSGWNWSKIPIIPFKYDSEEESLLARIKSLQDEYDKRVSSFANLIDDIPNSLKVIKDYDGTDKEEFIQNMQQYRTIFVQGTGDAKGIDTPFEYDGIEKHLERLRQDIYEFGQGVNTSNKDIRDTSGVALRFLYADLDMDCQDWASEMDWSLERLIWFICTDIYAKTGQDYSDIEYTIVYNTDVILNETETITNCMNSSGIISQQTIAANHPWVKDAKAEVDSLDEEQRKLQEAENSFNQNYGNSGGDK